ncbi:MAG: hypothetical protein CMO59_15190, partial [Verrucomicrobiales bacterium]|nr:hypothetical protein [Verrucomicrobiales bacterium]
MFADDGSFSVVDADRFYQVAGSLGDKGRAIEILSEAVTAENCESGGPGCVDELVVLRGNGAPLTDITAGILGALGAVSALVQRNASGQGQKVDTSLFEAGIVHTYWQSAICMATGVSPGPMGSAHPLNAPYQTFRTRDGWINVGAANQRNWERLLEVLGVPEMGSDPRFEDNHGRMDN